MRDQTVLITHTRERRSTQIVLAVCVRPTNIIFHIQAKGRGNAESRNPRSEARVPGTCAKLCPMGNGANSGRALAANKWGAVYNWFEYLIVASFFP